MSQEEEKGMEVRREILYQVGKYIGSGTFGEAYTITRQDTKETFIVKVNKNQTDLEDSKVEGDRLKSYHHKNIVRYVDNFVYNTGIGRAHFLIMENCEGGELREFIKNSGGKKENLKVYLKYFSDIIEGLVEIHGRK